MEKIICAAVRFGSKVWMGHRHCHAMDAMKDELSYSMTRREMIDLHVTEDQGFITSSGRYVDREEAWHIAKDAEQIFSDATEGQLFSEDLY